MQIVYENDTVTHSCVKHILNLAFKIFVSNRIQ